eukprot:scaffold34129_cov32-Tisochrysis_lutea.AAC.9
MCKTSRPWWVRNACQAASRVPLPKMRHPFRLRGQHGAAAARTKTRRLHALASQVHASAVGQAHEAVLCTTPTASAAIWGVSKPGSCLSL